MVGCFRGAAFVVVCLKFSAFGASYRRLEISVDGASQELEYDLHAETSVLRATADEFAARNHLDDSQRDAILEMMLEQRLFVAEYADLRDFWEMCDETFAHLSYDRWLHSKKRLEEVWRREWLDLLDPTLWRDATVVEYGIGGGALAELLLLDSDASMHLPQRGVAHYVGLDISARSLTAAKELLMTTRSTGVINQPRWTLMQVDALTNTTLQEVGRVDIFISLAVIQHFPSVEYTRAFFETLEHSGVRTLVLQTRQRGCRELARTSFTHEDLRYATCVETAELLNHLPSYILEFNTPEAEVEAGIVYHILTRKSTHERRPPPSHPYGV